MSGERELRVVVLSYGPGGEYRALLDSLWAEGIEPAGVLVVHNPSRPGEPGPSELGGSELLLADANRGYAGGMSLGIERQLGRPCELLLLLTHDARLRPGSLGALLEAARRHPEYGALGPVLLLAGGSEPFSYGGVDRGPRGLEHRKAPPPARDGIAACDWIDGGTMLLRAEPLRRLGGFDPRFWGYVEDAELCLRLRRAGLGVGVVLAASADQQPGGAKRPAPWAYLRARNGLAYERRARGRRGAARLAARILALVGWEAARAAARRLGLRPGPPAPPAAVAVGAGRGLLDFLRGRWGAPPADLPGASDLGNTEGGGG